MTVRLIVLITLLSSPTAWGDWLFGLNIESGGNTLAGYGPPASSAYETVNAGGGGRLYGGIRNEFGDGSLALQYTLGYQKDQISGVNGLAEFTVMPFEFMVLKQAGNWHLGTGLSWHLSPQYRDTLNPPVTLQYDDAMGAVFQAGYQFVGGLETGVRLTSIDYESATINHDGSSFGVYLQGNF